jgi:hypothetical protein
VLCNSDGHKGRHGASWPGASLFGAYGGLSCILATELSRQGLVDALRRRHHYGTTGSRVLLDTRARFAAPAELFEDDPNLGPATSRRVGEAMMGDILRTAERSVSFSAEVVTTAPIERVEIRNRLETLETFRPFAKEKLGRRIRVIWEGSEYRGRGRQTIWDGKAVLDGNRFELLEPINFWNLDKRFDQTAPGTVEWTALTTGGFGGFDAWLGDAESGVLRIDTALVKAEIKVRDIGIEDRVWDAGGIQRRIRVFRLPDENTHCRVVLERDIRLVDGVDNALYIAVTTEDGHRAWSSPIYVFR